MKKLISIILCVLLVFSVLVIINNSNKKVEDFTVEQHIQRVTERKKKSILNEENYNEEKYNSLVAYPLYDNNDKLKYFLIEYENYGGFSFVFLQDEPPVLEGLLLWLLHGNTSMYRSSSNGYSKTNPWTPYKRDKNTTALLPSFHEGWTNTIKGEVILDENGEMIIYDESPYYVTNNIKEKKYLLATDESSEYICAIKKGDKYLNLISGEEFEKADNYNFEENATIRITHYPHRIFDL